MTSKPIRPPTHFSVWVVTHDMGGVRCPDSAWQNAKLAHARAVKLGNGAKVEEMNVWTDPEAQEEDSKT
jgi:hypothetical protein